MCTVDKATPEEKGEGEKEGEGEATDVADSIGNNKRSRIILDGDELHGGGDDCEGPE